MNTDVESTTTDRFVPDQRQGGQPSSVVTTMGRPATQVVTLAAPLAMTSEGSSPGRFSVVTVLLRLWS